MIYDTFFYMLLTVVIVETNRCIQRKKNILVKWKQKLNRILNVSKILHLKCYRILRKGSTLKYTVKNLIYQVYCHIYDTEE